MKNLFKSIVLLILVFLSHKTFSQDVGETIRFKVQIPVLDVESLVKNKKVEKSFSVIGGSTKFIVISKTNEEVQVQAPNYKPLGTDYIEKKKKENGGKVPLDYSEYYNEKIYTVSKADFDLSAVIVEEKKKISVGILTLPFKARPQNDFSFDTEFNLNTTLNINLAHFDDYSFNGQIGAGIGSVGLNSNNASGLMENQDQDVSTLTFLFGLMLSHNNVQVGIYAGIDHINNQDNYNWNGNGKFWFAFGVGYNLFDIAKSTETNNKSE